jgi:hypothetical protein
MNPLYSVLAAIGLAFLASTAILHMRAHPAPPAGEDFDACAWS